MNNDFTDILELVCDKYNDLVDDTKELPHLEMDFIVTRINDFLCEEDIETLLMSDFGRGVISGLMVALNSAKAGQETEDEEGE